MAKKAAKKKTRKSSKACPYCGSTDKPSGCPECGEPEEDRNETPVEETSADEQPGADD